MKHIYALLSIVVLLSCKQKEEGPKEWVLENSIKMEGINPIGITILKNDIWISDGDHNRLVAINETGEIIRTIDFLERPMHIDSDHSTLYVPQYGKDNIATFNEDGVTNAWVLSDSLDAPAGVSVWNKEKAIADFYNNRILYSNGTKWISFGKEGKAEGEFYYPTDVQITEDKIWVADAYNNRVQVFDKKGNFLQQIGKEQKMNAATGIYVSEEEVFVTDFESNRVLIFDMQGNLKQELKKEIEKPTDMLIRDNKLYIINYRSGKLNQYELKETKKES